jgi:predicted nucleic acid-binding protein
MLPVDGTIWGNDSMVVRAYADTSVFGGVFDHVFAEPSMEFFQEVRADRFALVTSAVVQAELEPAPEDVRQFFEGLLDVAEVTEVTATALALRDAYLEAGIVSTKYTDDALHVALASVSGCRVIVSWNFRHIVHFEKIPKYNVVNVLHGHATLGIYSPTEVIRYEDQ